MDSMKPKVPEKGKSGIPEGGKGGHSVEKGKEGRVTETPKPHVDTGRPSTDTGGNTGS